MLETLDLALPNDANACVSKSGIAKVRERLGDEPLLWLFEQTARAWVAQDAAHYKGKGLALYAMDGTTFRTADSPENRLHFGAQGFASGKVASYPQVRGVSLTAVPTHLVADIAFGRYGCNEMLYAKPLIERIPDDSLTIFDKGFLAAEILWGLRMSGKGRHFLIPAKKNLKWELLSGSEDDGIVQMKASPQARSKNPALPETWTARAEGPQLNGINAKPFVFRAAFSILIPCFFRDFSWMIVLRLPIVSTSRRQRAGYIAKYARRYTGLSITGGVPAAICQAACTGGNGSLPRLTEVQLKNERSGEKPRKSMTSEGYSFALGGKDEGGQGA